MRSDGQTDLATKVYISSSSASDNRYHQRNRNISAVWLEYVVEQVFVTVFGSVRKHAICTVPYRGHHTFALEVVLVRRSRSIR